MYKINLSDKSLDRRLDVFVFNTIEDAEQYILDGIASLLLPQNIEYNVVDYSLEMQSLLSKQESIEALNLGMDIMADIRTLNKAKIAAQTLDFVALLADQTVANIERALWNGSLDTAKSLINGLQSFYSAEEKAPIVAKIDAHLAKWSE